MMNTAEGIVLTRQLLSLLESSTTLTEIEFNCEDTHIRLTGNHAGSQTPSRTPAKDLKSAAAPPVPDATNADPLSVKNKTAVIKAELHGVFYLSPSPGAVPFVNEGDAFEEGEQLAIIEAMKMLNVVEAPRKGRIIRVLAKDAEVVTPGTPLFETEVV